MVNRYWKKPAHPLYKDVVQGTGGIAGGRFVQNEPGDTNAWTQHYSVPDYLSGQDAYMEGGL